LRATAIQGDVVWPITAVPHSSQPAAKTGDRLPSRDVLWVAWWPGMFPRLAITLTLIALGIVGSVLQKRLSSPPAGC
jgi:hypothetical protein